MELAMPTSVRFKNIFLVASAASALMGLSMSMNTGSADAQQSQPGSIAPPVSQVVVQGRDSSFRVDGTLPQECVGSKVTVGLYVRGGGASVNQRSPETVAAETTVMPGGSFTASVPAPRLAAPKPFVAWPGVEGGCLTRPVVSVAPGLRFAVPDQAENGTDSGTFVIPKDSLFLGRAEQAVKIVLTASINGVTCAVADVTDPTTKDKDGNVRIHIGGRKQPPACSRDGAAIRFSIQGDLLLYEKWTLVLGVTQPMENLAPEAAPSTGPLPPAAGTGIGSGGSAGAWAIRACLAATLLGAAVFLSRRGPRGTR